ncbi:hypothetical protein [Rhizobium leguminosarum]|uniref:hypothetical protein n=1 Tax=Rhizobium leguminosarum TaxID=384 RepID=UPI003ED06DD1
MSLGPESCHCDASDDFDLSIFPTCLFTLPSLKRGGDSGPRWEPLKRHRSSTASPELDGAWQRTFLPDIHVRPERSGGQVRLSDKHWQKIFEILRRQDNVIALPPAVGSSYRYRPAATKSFRPHFGRAARRLKWRLRNVTIGFLVVAAVALDSKRSNSGEDNFSRPQ